MIEMSAQCHTTYPTSINSDIFCDLHTIIIKHPTLHIAS